jgi:hypothetical protein
MTNRLINFDQVDEVDGSLVFFEGNKEIPFDIKRIFYIFDVPNDDFRANHASTNSDFVLIAIHGKLTVWTDDGITKTEHVLTQKSQGILVPKMNWMRTGAFSGDAVLLVIASNSYDDTHYISDYNDFVDVVKTERRKKL